MLLPKRVKFRRHHRAKLKLKASTSISSKMQIVFGEYGLKAATSSWLTSRQLEATRRVITRYTRRTGNIWIRTFPSIPVTERAAESRMGSGKGALSYWIANISPDSVLFEINGLSRTSAFRVLRLASHKLPIKTDILTRR